MHKHGWGTDEHRQQTAEHRVIFNPDQWRGDVLGHAGNPAAVWDVVPHEVDRR